MTNRLEPLTFEEQLAMVEAEILTPKIKDFPFFSWDMRVVIDILWQALQDERIHARFQSELRSRTS